MNSKNRENLTEHWTKWRPWITKIGLRPSWPSWNAPRQKYRAVPTLHSSFDHRCHISAKKRTISNPVQLISENPSVRFGRCVPYLTEIATLHARPWTALFIFKRKWQVCYYRLWRHRRSMLCYGPARNRSSNRRTCSRELRLLRRDVAMLP